MRFFNKLVVLVAVFLATVSAASASTVTDYYQRFLSDYQVVQPTEEQAALVDLSLEVAEKHWDQSVGPDTYFCRQSHHGWRENGSVRIISNDTPLYSSSHRTFAKALNISAMDDGVPICYVLLHERFLASPVVACKILVHEIGHAYGLWTSPDVGHDPDPASIMSENSAAVEFQPCVEAIDAMHAEERAEVNRRSFTNASVAWQALLTREYSGVRCRAQRATSSIFWCVARKDRKTIRLKVKVDRSKLSPLPQGYKTQITSFRHKRTIPTFLRGFQKGRWVVGR